MRPVARNARATPRLLRATALRMLPGDCCEARRRSTKAGAPPARTWPVGDDSRGTGSARERNSMASPPRSTRGYREDAPAGRQGARHPVEAAFLGPSQAVAALPRGSRLPGIARNILINLYNLSVSLDVEAEVDDVAVLDDVVLALDAELADLAAARLAAELDEVAPVDDLGADEAALDVGVDLARGARGRGAARDRPGAALVGAGGEHRDEGDELEGGAQEAVARGLLEPERGDEVGLLGLGQLGDVHLDGGGEHDEAERARLGGGDDGLGRGGEDLGLGDVEHEQQRLLREQRVARERAALLGCEREPAQRGAALEHRLDALEQLELARRAAVLRE